MKYSFNVDHSTNYDTFELRDDHGCVTARYERPAWGETFKPSKERILKAFAMLVDLPNDTIVDRSLDC